MKRILVLSVATTLLLSAYAQSWQSGTQKLYTYPDTTKVGIGTNSPTERLQVYKGALKIGSTTSATDRTACLLKFGDGDYVQMGEWEADDLLSFKATKYNFTKGNVGIGVTTPQYKLDVNGILHLRTAAWEGTCANSYLYWPLHRLTMGTAKGIYSAAMVDIKPGGCTQDSLESCLQLYTAYSENNHVAKIQFWTMGNCIFNNTGNVGIGTLYPQHKLDVRGAIRANEIYVNVASGADFVFDEAYQLRPLSEVKEYVQRNQHLPEIPSAQEMQENGVNMNELQIQLLQKVEELTLYIIQQEQRIQELESQISK